MIKNLLKKKNQWLSVILGLAVLFSVHSALAATSVTLTPLGENLSPITGSYDEVFGVTSSPAPTTVANLNLVVLGVTGVTINSTPFTIPAGVAHVVVPAGAVSSGIYAAAVFNGTTIVGPVTAFSVTAISPSSQYSQSSQSQSSGTVPTVPLKGTVTATGQRDDSVPNKFAESFDVVPDSVAPAVANGTLEVFFGGRVLRQVSVSVPPGASSVSVVADNLGPGSYTATLYNTSRNPAGPSISFTVNDGGVCGSAAGTTVPAAPRGLTACAYGTSSTVANTSGMWTWSCTPPVPYAPATCSATASGTANGPLAPVTIGGVVIGFPTNQQTVTGTSATIKGNVAVTVPAPVNISYLWSVSGQPLASETPLLNVASMQTGQTTPITLTFSNLTPGTTYQFAIKNVGSNKLGSPLIFTTPGGATNESAVFEGVDVGNSGTPTPSTLTATIPGTGLVPRCGLTAGTDINGHAATTAEQQMCGLNDFIQLITNVIQGILLLIGVVATILAMYSGFMIIWLGKTSDPGPAVEEAIRKYSKQLLNIVIGLVIIVCAFLIVSTIIRELGVKSDYSLLDIVGL